MKTTRIRHRARSPSRWGNTAPVGGTPSSGTINGKFPCHPKRFDSRSQDRAENGDLIGSPTSANAAVLGDSSRSLGNVTVSTHPRTFKLLQSGRRKLARKIIEEACEVTVEAVKRDIDGVVRESADLLYHLVVLWFQMRIEPNAVWQEMQRRADTLGIAEKLPKLSDRADPLTDPSR